MASQKFVLGSLCVALFCCLAAGSAEPTKISVRKWADRISDFYSMVQSVSGLRSLSSKFLSDRMDGSAFESSELCSKIMGRLVSADDASEEQRHKQLTRNAFSRKRILRDVGMFTCSIVADAAVQHYTALLNPSNRYSSGGTYFYYCHFDGQFANDFHLIRSRENDVKVARTRRALFERIQQAAEVIGAIQPDFDPISLLPLFNSFVRAQKNDS